MSIKKSEGSNNVHCLFGIDSQFAQLIDLGEAKFVKRIPTYPIEPLLYVKVTMEGVWFRAFIQNFSSRHDNDVSDVQLRITPSTLTWITPRRNFDYSVQMYVIEVVFPADVTSF